MEDMGCSGFNLRHAVGMRQIQLSEVSTFVGEFEP
jgi:hypothetical protein